VHAPFSVWTAVVGGINYCFFFIIIIIGFF
jgi:hypothetical protein